MIANFASTPEDPLGWEGVNVDDFSGTDRQKIQDAIDTVKVNKGGWVNFGSGTYDLGDADVGIELYEGVRLRGTGGMKIEPLGTILEYNGPGRAINIEGGWDKSTDPWKFDPRRHIVIQGMKINAGLNAEAALWCYFVTEFEFYDLVLESACRYQIYMTNCHHGAMRKMELRNATHANLSLNVASLEKESVFSGQTYFENCSFHNCRERDALTPYCLLAMPLDSLQELENNLPEYIEVLDDELVQQLRERLEEKPKDPVDLPDSWVQAVEEAGISLETGTTLDLTPDVVAQIREVKPGLLWKLTPLMLLAMSPGALAGLPVPPPASWMQAAATRDLDPEPVTMADLTPDVVGLIADFALDQLQELTPSGVSINQQANVMAQLTFIKCHFKRNDYGVHIAGGRRPVFLDCQWESSTYRDMKVTGPFNPTVFGGFNNNDKKSASPAWELNGSDGIVQGMYFLDHKGIVLQINGDNTLIERNYFRLKSPEACQAIDLVGDQNRVVDNHFYEKDNCIRIAGKGNTIGRQHYTNENGYITDEGTDTFFQDSMILETPEWDLADGGLKTTILAKSGASGFVNRVWLLHLLEGDAIDFRMGLTVELGRARRGDLDDTKYLERLVDVDLQSTLTDLSSHLKGDRSLEQDAILIARIKPAGVVGVVKVKLVVEITPYRALKTT